MSDLDLMVASKQLDELVGRTIFKMWPEDHDPYGVVWYQPRPDDPSERLYAGVNLPGGSSWHDYLPKFSSDLVAAWLIVTHLKDGPTCYSFALWDVPLISSVQPGPLVAFRPHSVYPPREGDRAVLGYTVPMAICRAALDALSIIDADRQ